MRKVISLILVLMILFSAVQSPALAAAPERSNELDKMVQGIIDVANRTIIKFILYIK